MSPLQPLGTSTSPHQTLSSIIDNEEPNTLEVALGNISEGGRELWIATAFFSLDALNMLGEKLEVCQRICLLFGDNAAHSQRRTLLKAMRQRSDDDLGKERPKDPLLHGLKFAKKMIEEGRLVARCYKEKGFHAKAYLAFRPGHPPVAGILGSGNFTRSGLTMNVELNAHLTPDQTQQLKDWYEKKWDEAVADDVTEDLKAEISRQLDLYDPYAIYLKALFAWGDHVQGRSPLKPLDIIPLLDPHQEHAYRQALRILQREPGVMICDGVGLGKSFVALALMEHWLSEGSRILLVAPKAILKSSWEGYLRRYLGKYSKGFSNIHAKPMTWFGLGPDADPEELELLKEYAEQADVIVIDESHNFRNSATRRYENLYKVVAPTERGRKKIVLLTATPVNTHYEDLSNQFQLLTHEHGAISGIPRLQLNKQARNRDLEIAKAGPQPDQDTLFDYEGIWTDHLLGLALEAVVIQRSRATCRELADAAGKHLRFPSRTKPKEIRYELGYGHEAMIREASLRFKELGQYLVNYTNEVSAASNKERAVRSDFSQKPINGLKFSGYLPNLFLKDKPISNRQAQIEAFLAKMVFINVMKQLESSTPAFQSIIESLGQGLALRLRHYCGGEPHVQQALQHHEAWCRLPAKPEADDPDLGGDEEDAIADEASGGNTDDFVCREERRAIKRLQALGFGPETHHVSRWRDDILNDLDHLESIHSKCVAAQREPDSKLEEIVHHVQAERNKGRKVLVFSQSRRTADYVRGELRKRLGEEVALVNADVGGDTRARILNAFSPKYNDLPRRGKNQEMLPLPELNILVSTDVLSEGVNLQEAGCILNYDLHWNPTRLIQRIGRVDRRLNEGDPEHSFDILNVFPPAAINDVIQLVGTVEQRQRKISHLLGMDVSYFKSTDEEGTLKEFNRLYEGGVTARESQLVEYVRQVDLNSEDMLILESVPPGAFGVWEGAPVNGVFALFEMTGTDKLASQDADHFRAILGMPMLALESDGSISLDAPRVLEILAATVKSQPSANPSDANALKESLARLKNKVNQSFRAINLVSTIQPKLICWMEMRKPT